jgi:Family of unknown function (DUF6184)
MRYFKAALLFGSLLAGCSAQSESEPPLTPASGTAPAAERAVDAIAAARCDHEQRCDGVGPNRVYVNGEHCMRVMLADGQRELGVCRLGIDQADLRECLTEIHDGDCNSSLASLERVAACRVAELCVE